MRDCGCVHSEHFAAEVTLVAPCQHYLQRSHWWRSI